MEQKENNLEDSGVRLNEFKGEIEKLKKEEEEQGKIALAEVDPEELTLEDSEIWEKIKNETIAMEEMTQYMKNLTDERGRAKNGVSPSRINFMAFANNRAGGVIIVREMKKDLGKK